MRARRGERGFTLVEVMVAMLLTCVAVIGLMGLVVSETNAAGYSRHASEATALAFDKIEKLRTLGTAVASTGSEANLNERGGAGGIYQRSWTIAASAGFASITTSVAWSENGVPKSVTLYARRSP